MTKHTLTIVLDVPDGLESAVSDTAHHAIVRLDAETQANADRVLRHVGLFRHVAEGEALPQVMQDVIDRLNARVKRNRAAATCVIDALSEISHAMSEADSQWRRQHAATEPSE